MCVFPVSYCFSILEIFFSPVGVPLINSGKFMQKKTTLGCCPVNFVSANKDKCGETQLSLSVGQTSGQHSTPREEAGTQIPARCRHSTR